MYISHNWWKSNGTHSLIIFKFDKLHSVIQHYILVDSYRDSYHDVLGIQLKDAEICYGTLWGVSAASQVTISMAIAHQPVVVLGATSSQLPFLDLLSKPLVQK